VQAIITHEMADFDGLAGCVAAGKLYPEARIVLGRRLGTGLVDFLALHKDRFPTVRYTDIDPDSVTLLVVVDFRRRSRLDNFRELLDRVERGELEVHVYDHHAAAEDDLLGTVEVVQPVGSATTLLVEQIQLRGLDVDTLEATLFVLGIYADTGSLGYATTTSRDARAVAWLLDQGASLKVIGRYLRPAFTPEQRETLARMLGAVEVEDVDGFDIGFVVTPLEHAFTGLAEVTTEVAELEGHAALFAMYPIGGRRIQIVARSRSPRVDVGAVLEVVGGGGHPSAGAAIVHDADVAAVRRRLLEALQSGPPRAARVADIMSSPVRTVAPDMILAQLRDSLRTWRHTGVPVVDDGRLVGIVSRRDVEKAERDGRLHLPVSSCMSHNVKTTTLDATLDDALERMTAADVGRLPVLRDGRLVGILSRSDLLRVLYAQTGALG
jgi:tRNA nucleotidyltransferase (CCA-adding enzyme)